MYEIPGTTDIFQVENHPGKETDQLWNDYFTHVKVSKFFDESRRDKIRVRVPCHKYLECM
ncbi:hypothetical protein EJ02DRAFT_453971, partial [Clathrospora elynae]